MELIRRRYTVFIILFLTAGGVLCAQNTPMQLGVEIQSIEQKLSVAGISSAERRDGLVRLAQLRQLSGNIAAAANSWLSAVTADPNDDNARVSGAYCLAAIGEWEKAGSMLLPLLAAGRQGPSTLQAHFLNAFLKIQYSSNAGTLSALAEDSEFISLRPMIYYTLWQTLTRNPVISGAGGSEVWKSRLLAEFPQSPEARAADSNKQKDAPSISVVQSPLWLLFPGIGFSPLATVTPTAPPTAVIPETPPLAPKPVEAAGPAETVKPDETPVAPPPAVIINPAEIIKPVAPTPPPAPATVVLQTGLFSKEANARAQIESLRKAGFSATIFRKLVNGVEHWAVTVPAGQDSKKTTADLKKAGFDSFPTKF